MLKYLIIVLFLTLASCNLSFHSKLPWKDYHGLKYFIGEWNAIYDDQKIILNILEGDFPSNLIFHLNDGNKKLAVEGGFVSIGNLIVLQLNLNKLSVIGESDNFSGYMLFKIIPIDESSFYLSSIDILNLNNIILNDAKFTSLKKACMKNINTYFENILNNCSLSKPLLLDYSDLIFNNQEAIFNNQIIFKLNI